MDEFDWLFQGLKITESELRSEMVKNCVPQRIPKGTLLVEEGKMVKWLIIVVSGRVRVWQENEGREIMLYYVETMQTCALSLSSAFKDFTSVVFAKTVEDSTVIKIPVRLIVEWGFKFNSWSKFMMNTLVVSYDDLLRSHKKLAFNNVDQRLIEYLNLESKKCNSIKIFMSHSQLANEIGSTREVVSKILKQFERSGIVSLKFRQVELLRTFI